MLKDKNAVLINENDNCMVTLEEAKKGDTIFGINILENIPAGHKIAIKNISIRENIIKYGYPIGHAICNIKIGSHIHTHNIKTNLSKILNYTYQPKVKNIEKEELKFLGFKRKNGEIGIRNEIWIINTVGCINKSAEKIAEKANELYKTKIDGVFTFTHPFGCSQLGDDLKTTQIILSNMVSHPNAAGVLILSLGCENNNLDEFKKLIVETDDNRIKYLVAQNVENEVEEGLKLIKELVNYAENFKREEVSIENLVIGLKCGGSDGLSGITANPLVGKLTDKIISYGGSAILTEVPEMFGAEQILMDRCRNENLFNKTVDMINDFKNYFIRYKQEIYENPSPGNKKGGISTLEDKSLGCTQKAGSNNVVDVLNYGDTVKINGLNLLNGPGNDIVAMTNLLAAHAHLILFTTGRGTPAGTGVPTIKISSNTNLFNKKRNWIDFNAAIILEQKNIEEATNEFFKLVLEVIEGKKTKNEINGYREIAIFKDGVTL